MSNGFFNALICIIVIVSSVYMLVSTLDVQDKKPDPLNVVESYNNAKTVNTVLQNLMETTAADRAYTFQFHNGIHGVRGRNFCYYSNTHEVTAPGVSAEIRDLQNLPISILAPSWMPKMQQQKSWFMRVVDEPHEQTKHILEDQGIKAIAIARVKYGMDIIGFVGIDWVKVAPVDPDLPQLEEAASLIQSLLIGGK